MHVTVGMRKLVNTQILEPQLTESAHPVMEPRDMFVQQVSQVSLIIRQVQEIDA